MENAEPLSHLFFVNAKPYRILQPLPISPEHLQGQ